MTETDPDWLYYRHHSRGSTGALVLILVGLVFLLNNFGLLPWTVWGYLLRLWPIILIVIGVKIVFGRTRLAYFLATFITLASIILVLALALAPTNPQIDRYLNTYLPGLSQQVNSSQDINSQDFNQNDNSSNFFSY